MAAAEQTPDYRFPWQREGKGGERPRMGVGPLWWGLFRGFQENSSLFWGRTLCQSLPPGGGEGEKPAY